MSAASLAERLAVRIAEHGPLAVSDYVEAALYDEVDGFYATRGRAGREGDFLTSPEVGPLFGAVIARAVDTWWDEAGRPDRWTVVEHGAGPGTLARSVLAAEPECLQTGALSWVAIDRAPVQRRAHPVHPSVMSAGIDDPAGGWLPPEVVLANEMLDNLPFDVVERTVGGWASVLIDRDDGGFRTIVGEPTTVAPSIEPVAPGVRLPVQLAARGWLAKAHQQPAGTRILVLDYGAPTAELAARGGGWLRSYREHDTPGDWLEDPGTRDITVDVDLDQLQADHPATTVDTQAGFLRRHGIDELVEEGRAAWRAGAAVGDLAALRARSRIREAEALLDPSGMGAFAALEWVV